jgi:hypothetical protein
MGRAIFFERKVPLAGSLALKASSPFLFTHFWNVARYALFTARCQGLFSISRNYFFMAGTKTPRQCNGTFSGMLCFQIAGKQKQAKSPLVISCRPARRFSFERTGKRRALFIFGQRRA